MGNRREQGVLIVISGPSGTGKGTVVEAVMGSGENLFLSVSATTRPPRPHETPGVHYHFVSKGEFASLIEKGELLEYAEYAGEYYGTLASQVKKRLSEGADVILEIDVQGGIRVKENMPQVVLVFLIPPSVGELERRLRGRGTEDETYIRKRLSITASELLAAEKYDYIVENDRVEAAARDIHAILRVERLRFERRQSALENIKNSLEETHL